MHTDINCTAHKDYKNTCVTFIYVASVRFLFLFFFLFSINKHIGHCELRQANQHRTNRAQFFLFTLNRLMLC